MIAAGLAIVARLGTQRTSGRSPSAIEIMFFICLRKNRMFSGFTLDASITRCTRVRSSRLFTQLLGTASTCLKEPVPSVTRSSQSFLPSAPCTGREKKSSSHCVDGAAAVLGDTASRETTVAASRVVRACVGLREQLWSKLNPSTEEIKSRAPPRKGLHAQPM